MMFGFGSFPPYVPSEVEHHPVRESVKGENLDPVFVPGQHWSRSLERQLPTPSKSLVATMGARLDELGPVHIKLH